MSDTLVALSAYTADASVLFAKNSDRSPNEPQELIRTFPVNYPSDATVECTYITIQQAEHTNACLLCKPSWAWGCEMGTNEFGLHVGCSGVSTREPAGHEPGLIGMDMVRLALERTQKAREAADLIIALLMRYGQSGDSGFDSPEYLHASFMIADAMDAYVLETAGEYWALKRVDSVYAMSDALTIEDDYDEIHAGAVAHAIEKRWCRDEASFRFASCYGNKKRSVQMGSEQRRQMMLQTLKKGTTTTQDMIRILRTHHAGAKPFRKGSMLDICMHAGPHGCAMQTTGSMVGRISNGFATEFITGASAPCMSIFKPYWLQAETTQLVLPMYAERAAREGWIWREQINRGMLKGEFPADAVEEYLKRRETLEERFYVQSDQLHNRRADADKLTVVAKQSVQDEIDLLNELLEKREEKGSIRGSIGFKWYWNKKNRTLGVRRPNEP